MGSGGSSTPGPTEQETALQAYQLQLLQKQQAQSDALEPLMLASYGYKRTYSPVTSTPTFNEAAAKQAYNQYADAVIGQNSQTSLDSASSGTISRPESVMSYDDWLAPRKGMFMEGKQSGGEVGYSPMSQAEQDALLTPEQIRERELTREYQELQLKAMRGEMSISPALEEELTNQRAVMENTLATKLGPNWKTTTPGIQAMKAFDEAVALTREEARRGQVNQGSQILSNQMVTQYNPSRLGYFNNTMEPGYSQLDRIPGLLQPYQTYSGLQNQASMANAQARSQRNAAMIGTGGMIAAGVGMAI